MGQSGDVWLYENPCVLPLGFMIPQAMDLDWNLEAENPADVQNQLSDLLNVPYMLIDMPGEYNGNTFTFTPEESGEYYVYVTNRSVETVTATWGDQTKTFSHVNRCLVYTSFHSRYIHGHLRPFKASVFQSRKAVCGLFRQLFLQSPCGEMPQMRRAGDGDRSGDPQAGGF